jgi:predicted RNase H-like nuclease (RuvC/YqgF family)
MSHRTSAPDKQRTIATLENAIAALREQLTRSEARADSLQDELTRERCRTAADPLTVIGIQTLSQTVEMLHEDLAIANRSLVSERERAEQAERRADDLLALLAEGQRQIGDLYGALADARTAAMISSNGAAALRARLEVLTGPRVPWWRRWFR